jgi:hypothetical protein
MKGKQKWTDRVSNTKVLKMNKGKINILEAIADV